MSTYGALSEREWSDVTQHYLRSLRWLRDYDEGLLIEPAGSEDGVLPSEQEATELLLTLKQTLMQRGEATPLFARPRGDGLGAILGNLAQTVFGEPAYATLESRAAHLLYFVVKNHPFTDGNKRSGAFLLVAFLHRNQRLLDDSGRPVLSDTTLAAMTLMIAESHPDQKEMMVRLVMNMLASIVNM